MDEVAHWALPLPMPIPIRYSHSMVDGGFELMS